MTTFLSAVRADAASGRHSPMSGERAWASAIEDAACARAETSADHNPTNTIARLVDAWGACAPPFAGFVEHAARRIARLAVRAPSHRGTVG